MESKGKLISVSVDFKTQKRLLTFEVDNVSDEELNRLLGLDTLDIKAVRHTKKRSNEANAYHWKLCGMIAAALKAGLQETHKNLMLRYGTISEKDGVAEYRIVPMSYEPTENEYWLLGGVVHLKNKKGEEVPHNMFWVIKESHKYNSKEMSTLIDGTVLEAKEQGIETLPRDELKRLMDEFEKTVKQSKDDSQDRDY